MRQVILRFALENGVVHDVAMGESDAKAYIATYMGPGLPVIVGDNSAPLPWAIRSAAILSLSIMLMPTGAVVPGIPTSGQPYRGIN